MYYTCTFVKCITKYYRYSMPNYLYFDQFDKAFIRERTIRKLVGFDEHDFVRYVTYKPNFLLFGKILRMKLHSKDVLHISMEIHRRQFDRCIFLNIVLKGPLIKDE